MAVDGVTGEGDVELDETSRQIEQNHKALHALFDGTTPMVVMQSVASFMGCTMMHLVHTAPDDAMTYTRHFISDVLKFGHIAQLMLQEQQTKGASDGNQEAQG